MSHSGGRMDERRKLVVAFRNFAKAPKKKRNLACVGNLVLKKPYYPSGFGGLQISVLAFGTRVRGFKPGRCRRIYRAKKILSLPSFGGEVKPSVPCRKFTACKRTQKWRGSLNFRQNSRLFLAHSSTFRCWGSLAWGTPGGGSWNVLITGPPGWGGGHAAGNGTL